MQAQDSRNYLHAHTLSFASMLLRNLKEAQAQTTQETKKGLLTCKFCVILDQVPLLI